MWALAPIVFLLAAAPAQAITINAIYRASGESLGTFGTAAAQPGNAVGGGNLTVAVDAAVAYWESAFADPFTLTIEYGWFPRDGGTTGTHRLVSEGGTPHRETAGTIAIDSDGSTIWFADPTPDDSSEFATFTEFTSDLGGGSMNVGREFTGASGPAVRHDLFSTVLHEIGHALGLSSANNAYVAEGGDGDVDITAPLPFAGGSLPLNAGDAHLNLAHALLRSSRPSGVRRYASEADILALAQISQFTQVNLTPVVPEPSSFAILAVGLIAVAWHARRRSG
jgi:large exoprotein involved in heme utilization and adhesion